MTYSFNTGTTYTEFLGIEINDILSKIPNNTYEKIVPKDIRDGLLTIWDNLSYKPTTSGFTSSVVEYNGVTGKNILDRYKSGSDGFKMLIGKPIYNGSNLFNDTILGYNSSNISYPNADLIIYNNKPDDYGTNDTKILLLAGDNTDIPFNEAPYIEVVKNGGTTPSYTLSIKIPNEFSSINVEAANINIGATTSTLNLLYDPTTSSGILNKPVGNIGDLQFNLDNCYFGNISGASASIGDVLVMGATNTPYWTSVSNTMIYSLSSVLQVGNETTGTDILISDTDKIIFGNDSVYALEMYNSGTISYITGGTGSYLDVDVSYLKLNITGIGSNRILFTDSNGFAEWRAVSILASGTGGSIQLNDGSNGFTHDNTFLYDTTNKSLKINTSGLSGTYSYSLSVNANTKGGFYVYGVESAVATYSLLNVTDTTSGAVYINMVDSSTDKTVYLAQNGLTNIAMFISSWATSANSDDNMVIGFRNGKNKLTLQGYGSTHSVVMNFQTSGTKTPKSKISINETGTGDDFNFLTKVGNKSARFGYYNGSTITSLINLYTSTHTSATEASNVIILGNTTPAVAVPVDLLLSSTNRVLLGINTSPKTSLDIYGTISNRTIQGVRVGDDNNMLQYVSSSIFINDTLISTFTGDGYINRLDDFININNIIPFGATIKIANISSQTIEFLHVGIDISLGTYDQTLANNILFYEYRNLNEIIPMHPGQVFTFTAVEIDKMDVINPLISSLSGAEILVNDNILWLYEYNDLVM